MTKTGVYVPIFWYRLWVVASILACVVSIARLIFDLAVI